jgi:hypothetical protein
MMVTHRRILSPLRLPFRHTGFSLLLKDLRFFTPWQLSLSPHFLPIF